MMPVRLSGGLFVLVIEVATSVAVGVEAVLSRSTSTSIGLCALTALIGAGAVDTACWVWRLITTDQDDDPGDPPPGPA